MRSTFERFLLSVPPFFVFFYPFSGLNLFIQSCFCGIPILGLLGLLWGIFGRLGDLENNPRFKLKQNQFLKTVLFIHLVDFPIFTKENIRTYKKIIGKTIGKHKNIQGGGAGGRPPPLYLLTFPMIFSYSNEKYEKSVKLINKN